MTFTKPSYLTNSQDVESQINSVKYPLTIILGG